MIYLNIKQACNKKKISIRKLENDLGLSNGSICKWDKHKPSIESAKKVADYLDLKIDDLMKEGEEVI